jgi:hypothetical protein
VHPNTQGPGGDGGACALGRLLLYFLSGACCSLVLFGRGARVNPIDSRLINGPRRASSRLRRAALGALIMHPAAAGARYSAGAAISSPWFRESG